MSQAVLFKQEGQHIFDYTNVYDPDVDGADPSASGKIIPAVRSIVIDNRSSTWKIYLVKSVDSKTYKCTYVDFPYKAIDRRSMILNYGNDVFMLYYDNRTSPTRLTVDAKMILFGSNIASYRLVKDSKVISSTLNRSVNKQFRAYRKVNPALNRALSEVVYVPVNYDDGGNEVEVAVDTPVYSILTNANNRVTKVGYVSAFYVPTAQQSNPNYERGIVVSETNFIRDHAYDSVAPMPDYAVSQIPVIEVTDQYVDGVRRCNTCYTTSVLSDGDIVTLELFDSTGVMIAEVELIARKSTILNSLSAALNPITGFTATANQMLGNDWYLYKGQNKDTLSIYPEIRFANGTSVVVPVDNNACFLYGFKEVSTAESGKNFPVLVKYYVNSRYQVDPSLNIVAGTKRVLCSEHLVRIVDKPVGSISKISVIPVWIESTGRYGLRMLAYNTDRIPPSDITAKIMNPATSYTTALQGVIIDGSFTPNLFNVEQNFTIKFTIPVENGHNVEYTQSFDLVLKNKNTLQEAGEGRALWNIIDPNNGECVYGVDNVTHNRPVIYWDETNQRHYISTEEFPTVEEFLEVFYRRSAPPANPDAGESVAPTPTRFWFRDIDGNVLSDGAYEVNAYHRGVIINDAFTGLPVKGGVIVMEFLYHVNGTNSPAYIYGVPVIVEENDGGYRPDSNDTVTG